MSVPPNIDLPSGEPEDVTEFNPLEEVSPMGDSTDDLGSLHQQRQQRLRDQATIRNARAEIAARESSAAAVPEAAAAPPTPETEERDAAQIARDVAVDLGLGVINIPREILGGVVDSVQESAVAVDDLADMFPDFLQVGIVYEPGVGLRFVTGEAFRATRGLTDKLVDSVVPDIAPSGTTTGKMVRSITSFGVGFLGAGKLKAVARLAQLGRVGKVGALAARGAISDFLVFDPDEERLANMVEEFPVIGPAAALLAMDPDDSGFEGRLKQSVEGLGLGVAGETLFRGIRVLAKMRQAKLLAEVTPDTTRTVLAKAQFEREQMEAALGSTADGARKVTIRVADPPAALPAGAPDPPTEVFINWNTINEPDDVLEVMQEMADGLAPSIEQARRGVRTWEQTRISADGLDAWEIIQSRARGETLNAEQTVAVRELWVQSGVKLRELAAASANEPASDLRKIALRSQISRHSMIQESVIATRTETMRSANAWAIPVGGDNVEFKQQMEELTNLIRSDRDIEDLAKRIVALDDPNLVKEMEAFIFASSRAKGVDMIRQSFYGSLLSMIHTHARNVIGSVSSLSLQMIERKGANLLGKMRGKENVVDGEASAQLFGMVRATGEALRMSAKGAQILRRARRLRIRGDHTEARALVAENEGEFGAGPRSFATRERVFGASKLDVPQEGAFEPGRVRPKRDSLFGKFIERTGQGTLGPEGAGAAGKEPQRIGIDKESSLGRIFAWVDSTTSAPMGALGAEDEVFKAAAWQMEMRAGALRKVTAELNSGELLEVDKLDRIATLISNPDEEMRLAAQSFAQVSTFTNEPLDSSLWKLWQAAGNVPVIGKLTLPFRRTPYNIATFTFQRTPIAPFMKSFQVELAAGGARADLAWTRFMMGSGILLSMADLAMNGILTGDGPRDPRERQTLERLGWKPNSVRIQTGVDANGNEQFRYFSYRGLEPGASPMSTAANIVDILKYQDWEEDDVELDELMIATGMSIAANVTSQQYMSGVSGMFEVLADPQRYGENWWERTSTIMAPRAIVGITQFVDPTQRAVNGMFEAWWAKTPGLSKLLPAVTDLWGRPIVRASGLGDLYDFISPIYSGTNLNAQPIDRELNRLELWVGKPGQTINVGGAKKNLRNSPEIYSRYVMLAGNEVTRDNFGVVIDLGGKGLMDTLNDLVSGNHPMSGMYAAGSDGPDGDKAIMIEEKVDDFRRAAKDALFREFPELKAELVKRAEKLPSAVEGVPSRLSLF